MIAGHIEDLIHAAKELPNGLHRNKIISHLEDARAHAQVLEIEARADGSRPKIVSDKLCSCPHYPDAQSLNCPVHSK